MCSLAQVKKTERQKEWDVSVLRCSLFAYRATACCSELIHRKWFAERVSQVCPWILHVTFDILAARLITNQCHDCVPSLVEQEDRWMNERSWVRATNLLEMLKHIFVPWVCYAGGIWDHRFFSRIGSPFSLWEWQASDRTSKIGTSFLMHSNWPRVRVLAVWDAVEARILPCRCPTNQALHLMRRPQSNV